MLYGPGALFCHAECLDAWEQSLEDALHGMSLVVVVFLGRFWIELILYVELLGVAGLRVETLGVLVGRITGYSWIRVGMKIEVLSLDFLSSSFGNNSVHRIIVCMLDDWMYAGSMWIQPYVLLVEEMQIQPLF